MKHFKEWLIDVPSRPVLTSICVFVFAATTVGLLSLPFYLRKDEEFLEGVLVEAHGMLLDILVLGVLVLWLNKLGEKRTEIKRYKGEIDDFRHWHVDEATHRIAGNIIRLYTLGVKEINLKSCYLANANLDDAILIEAILIEANLSGAKLPGADLSRADLSRADLSRADLSGADFSRAKLLGADLTRAKLPGADLSGADLSGAYLPRADFSGAFYDKDTEFPEGFSPEKMHFRSVKNRREKVQKEESC